MEKLYYTDRYKKEFFAKVEKIQKREDVYLVELDKTAFFPGGGGQFSDRGMIDGKEVIDMIEEDGRIYHVMKEKLTKKEVKGVIDWDRREDGMHQHFGQHVLSGCFYTKYHKNTCGFHLGEEISTVDIEGDLTEEQIIYIEKMANDIIKQNIHVEIFVPSKDELKETWTRRKLPDTAEEIRIVKIGDLDTNACCGCHPEYTGELKLLKIKRTEKSRNATRVEFLAGTRAIEYVLKRDNVMSKICKHLSCNEENIEKCILNIENNLDDIIHQRNILEEELLNYKIDKLLKNSNKIGNIEIIKHIFKDKDAKYLNKIVKKLTEKKNIIIMLFNTTTDKVNVVFAYNKGMEGPDLNKIFQKNINILDGKGGGNKYLTQGAGKNNNRLDEFIEKSYKSILNYFE
ncbi:alanyl-tRNA editing protein [Peptacetobacter sp.]|uniref:alanyl-tRNA editing protein n=1 Tax=Peptacetobacter sp. TaxID=2991975 RepID=UPI002620BD5F|nr:DHHA1 domain-containing protein [Peptacetobacter sp.]